jgi:YD repeat-containing protein
MPPPGYDALNRVVREIDPLGLSRSYSYDPNGNLLSRTDRTGRGVSYAYDPLDRRTTETWQGAGGRTISTTYNAANLVLTASDPDAAFTYQYDKLGRPTQLSTTIANSPVPTVVQTATYLADGLRQTLTAAVGGSADFRDTYQYDRLSRLTDLRQDAQPGSSNVAAKHLTLGYNGVDQLASVQRSGGPTGSTLVAGTTFSYDPGDRLAALTHSPAVGSPLGYTFGYDADDRLTAQPLPGGESRTG